MALTRLLPLPLLSGIAGIAGAGAFYLWPRGRRAMLRNYRRVLPSSSPAERRRVARRSLGNYCRYLVEFAAAPRRPPAQRREAVVDTAGLVSLDAALAKGQGAIAVSLHFGNWDVGAAAAAARGYPVTAVGESFADARLDAMIVDGRERLGVRLVKMERAASALVRALRRNELAAILIDRPLEEGGVRVRFFGEEVEVPAGPARIALRTGAAAGAVAFPRVAPGRVDVVADFQLPFEATGERERDVQALTQAIMTANEALVRAYPDQWYMFREFWRPRAGPRASREC